ncbi:PH domain-containing protein [Geomonas oryzae]|uniref:PH domain-containing protein n=1 Tax=Geomonas oryzae TaxID=2364273 RepID=UPI00100B409E|nr:PH domain-containing protein [Geomonas oryzae]
MDDLAIFEGYPAWTNYSVGLGLAAIFALGSFSSPTLLFFAGCMVAVIAWKRFGIHGRVTSTRIITKFGIFNTRTYEIEIKDIRSINVSQNLLQKIFDLGTLEFATSSGPMKEAALVGIKKPDALKEQIRALSLSGA